jgi:uncharacterized oxidoreductase
MKLENKTILITGGASGIGLALAVALVYRGNRVVVCGRNREKLRQAEKLLPSITTMSCDITEPADLSDLYRRLENRFPELDLLFNNAGIQTAMDFRAGVVDESLIDRELRTNLTAHIDVTNRLYPLLSARPESAIVFIGSVLGQVPKFSAPVYSAAKAGLHCYAQCLRGQLAATSTRVVEVIPDLVDTAMTGDRVNARKIRPDQLAREVMDGLVRDREQIMIGRTGLLLGINRLSPELAHSLVNGRRPEKPV